MGTYSSKLSGYLKEASNLLIFTGAGISTESGISDYRSKGGLWKRFQPVTIQEFVASEEKRLEYWETKRELYQSFCNVQPNDGHKAIVALQEQKKCMGVITQNIDGLHKIAGTDKDLIVELHGNNRETVCLSCNDCTGWEETYGRLQEETSSLCCLKCGGYLKPNTISFGQSLDPAVLDKAMRLTHQCDLFLAIGSTLVVEPAASLPRLAKQNGAKLVILTLGETPLDSVADCKIDAQAGEVLRNAVKDLHF